MSREIGQLFCLSGSLVRSLANIRAKPLFFVQHRDAREVAPADFRDESAEFSWVSYGSQYDSTLLQRLMAAL
jgi:hypothetical protein